MLCVFFFLNFSAERGDSKKSAGRCHRYPVHSVVLSCALDAALSAAHQLPTPSLC